MFFCNRKHAAVVKEEETEEAVDRVINSILSDPEHNFSLIPDALERQIYRKISESAISSLRAALSQIDIKILGHRLEFRLVPQIEVDIPEDDA